jgi:hypothetical protein
MNLNWRSPQGGERRNGCSESVSRHRLYHHRVPRLIHFLSVLQPWLTSALALYGAGLATYSFWKSRMDRRPRLEVSFGPVITERPKSRVIMYGVFIRNIGSKDVHLPDGCTYVRFRGVDKDLPFDLAPESPCMPSLLVAGTACTAHLSRADFHWLVQQHLGEVTVAKMKGGVIDAVGNRYASRWISIDNIDVRDRIQIGGLFN